MIIIFTTGLGLGWWLPRLGKPADDSLLSPLVELQQPLPLKKYTLNNLKNYPFQTSELKVERELEKTSDYTSYLFSFHPMGKKMTGVINVPSRRDAFLEPQVVVMLRGYVPAESYESGVGTKNAATYFAQRGLITVAPDFFGYGESESEFEDEWEARLAKPVQVIELIRSIQKHGVPTDNTAFRQEPTQKVGLWAHSNGGQIALTTLEVLQQPLPTTLWAPVTAPFPYSVLFYSDEEADEGKAARAWVQLFEKKYDVFDFSLTKHLQNLTGEIQIHHGSHDEAAPIAWSDEFVDKLELENQRRQEASASASPELPPVIVTYYRYPGADHNLRPDWNTVVARDLQFFLANLK